MFYIADADEIKKGSITDVYFKRAVEILEKESYLFDPDIFQAFKELIGLIKMSGSNGNVTGDGKT